VARRREKWQFSQAEIAEICGVSPRTIRRWAQKGLPGGDEAGRYDVRQVVGWLREQSEAISEDRERWEVEKLRRQVGKLDVELARLHAEVVEWEMVENWVAEFGRLVAGVVERAQRRCSGSCGEDVGRVLMDGLKQIRTSCKRFAQRKE